MWKVLVVGLRSGRVLCTVPENTTVLQKKPCSSMSRTPPQLQPRQIPTAPHMGPAPSIFTNVPVQTNTTANNYSQHITPYWYPLLHTPPPITSPTIHLGRGATYFFLLLSTMVSTHIHPKHPLSLSTFRPTAVPSW